MATAAERQKKFRASMKDRGLVPVTGFVPERSAGDVQRILRLLCENPDFEIPVLRDPKTGRFVKV